MTALEELRLLIERHCKDFVTPTKIPGLALMRADAPSVCEIPGVYAPMVCVGAQGLKQVTVGSTTLQYDETNYLISSVDMPLSGQVIRASPERPYLAFGFELDLKLLATIVSEMPLGKVKEATVRGIAVSAQSADLLDAFVRLLKLLDRPADIDPLAPLIMREIYYRLLNGEKSTMLHQMLLHESRTAQITRVIDWIRKNYDESLHIGKLAELAKMSPASLHRHFKAVTALSPLQYQKRVRLQEARQILISGNKDAASAGFAVGYGSPSQFSREYHRLFGAPPQQDMERLRSTVESVQNLNVA